MKELECPNCGAKVIYDLDSLLEPLVTCEDCGIVIALVQI